MSCHPEVDSAESAPTPMVRGSGIFCGSWSASGPVRNPLISGGVRAVSLWCELVYGIAVVYGLLLLSAASTT